MGGNGSAADLVFVNGAVYTVDAMRSWAQAVAVRDGRVALVGTDDDVRAAIGPGTEVIDLAGRMLIPGFQDAHVHQYLRASTCSSATCTNWTPRTGT